MEPRTRRRGGGGNLPEELWLDAPLDRVPPDPPKWIDDLADSVEEKRLQESTPSHKRTSTWAQDAAYEVCP